MAAKPILFSGPMVRAILDGRKSQTRRVLKGGGFIEPKYAPGDRLYVRESVRSCCLVGYPHIEYRADETAEPCDIAQAKALGGEKWRPGIHMPRWASRITLLVTEVRVQRLQEISEEDALAEGVFVPEAQYAQQGQIAPVLAFAALWNSINGPGAWEASPFVAAYSFDVIRQNVDAYLAAQAAAKPHEMPAGEEGR